MARFLRRRRPSDEPPPRPAARYVRAGEVEARRLGHSYLGTEHVLLALARTDGGAFRLLGTLGVTPKDVEESRLLEELWGPDWAQRRQALPAAVGDRKLDCIAPRLKQALESAVERAAGEPVLEEHVLLGMLGVRDSLAARILGERGVSLETAEAGWRRIRPTT